MESFLSRYRNPLILLTVVLVQLLGLAVQVRRTPSHPGGEQVSLIRYWVVSLVTPIERIFLFSGHGLSGTWNNYIDLRHVRQQNAQLQAELDRMRLEQASLAEAARQDIRLQRLLGFQQQYVAKTVAAHVIGTSGSELSRVLYIDKGFDNGVRIDQPVITPDGVVGKIRNVFAGTAQVLELNDPTSGLGVILTQTRLRGILRGNTAGQLEIVDVLPDERIEPGEPVVTSGGDGIFPRGMPVGAVERAIADPERNPYVALLVKPAVNLTRLDEVLVVTQTSDAMPAAMQQDVTTSEQKAADILAQRLPGAAVEPQLGPDGKPIDANAPPPPVRPPAPLHPDRFTPGATPPATSLQPGATYPVQTFAAQPAASAPSTVGSAAEPSQSAPAHAKSDSAAAPAHSVATKPDARPARTAGAAHGRKNSTTTSTPANPESQPQP